MKHLRLFVLTVAVLLITPAVVNLSAGACLDLYNEEIEDAKVQYNNCMAWMDAYNGSITCGTAFMSRASVVYANYRFCTLFQTGGY